MKVAWRAEYWAACLVEYLAGQKAAYWVASTVVRRAASRADMRAVQ
jgi:hypothetical protein